MISVRLRFILLAGLVWGCALGGCGGGSGSTGRDTNTPVNDPTSLVGTWTARSLSDSVTTQTCPAAFITFSTITGQFGAQCTSKDTITFYADGGCRINGGATLYLYAVTPGTNKVNITLSGSTTVGGAMSNAIGEIASGVFDLTNNTLTLNPATGYNVNTFAVQAIPSSGTVQELYQRTAPITTVR